MARPTQPLLVLLAVIAAVQGIALIGYAVYDIVQGLRLGLTGPEEVSNLPGLILQIVIFAVLGGASVVIAVGWWRAKYAARAPFIVAQLLALVVGFPLAQGSGSLQSGVGVALIAVALIGIAVALLPPVTRAIVSE
jgi:MFS family permease